MSTTACLKKLRDCALEAQASRREAKSKMGESECSLLAGLESALSADDDGTIGKEHVQPVLRALKKHHAGSLVNPSVRDLVAAAEVRFL